MREKLLITAVIASACTIDPPEQAATSRTAASGSVLDVPTLNTSRAQRIGREVTVEGYLLGVTKQGRPVEQINVSIGASKDISSESILCVVPPDDTGVSRKTLSHAVRVQGRVAEDDFFDAARLDDCHLAGTPAPTAKRAQSPKAQSPKAQFPKKGGKRHPRSKRHKR